MDTEAGRWARWSRLRWRMRGAWQWPTFTACLIGDAILLDRLPASGDGGDLAGGLLLAGFMNIIVLALLAPLAGRLLRRRRPDLPRVVAGDYAGTTLLLVAACALAGLGIAHRPAVLAHARAFQAQSDAVRAYVMLHGDAIERRNLDRADSLRLEESYFRTCVPRGDADHALCLFVDTSRSPPSLRIDSNPIPNARYFGPHVLGRSG